MPQSEIGNCRFVLAERPKGKPTDETLRLEFGDVTTPGPKPLLLHNASTTRSSSTLPTPLPELMKFEWLGLSGAG